MEEDKKTKIISLILTIVKYAVTALIGYFGGNAVL